MTTEAHNPQPTLPPEVIQRYAAFIVQHMEARLRETMDLIEDATRPVEMRRSYVAQTILALTEVLQDAHPTATHIDGIDLMLETFTLLIAKSGTKKMNTGMGKAQLFNFLKPPSP